MKTTSGIRCAAALLIPILAAALHAQPERTVSPVFLPGEELQYSVHWQFLRLGTIIVRTVPEPSDSSGRLVRVFMLVESNPSLPFVSISEHNEALVDAVTGRSLRYLGIHRSDDVTDSVSHQFFPSDRVARSELHAAGPEGKTRLSVIRNVDWYVEGTTLYYYARHAAQPGRHVEVPTLVKGQIQRTVLEYDPDTEEIEIDAWDEPVRVRRYSGLAEWSGATTAGVTGVFVGWLSDDEAAIPLRAELQIFLGSIDIELERWSRNGWTPTPIVTTASR